jgi:hypothetical protein
MAVDNSRFLAITSSEPNINTGWQIRIRDYKDMSTLVAICNEFDSFAFTQQLNDPGTGSLTIDTDSPWWNQRLNNGRSARSLLDNEYVLEAWEGGVARFAWLAQTVENTIVGEDETHKTTISGPGIAQTLTWACIMRPGWPKKPPKVGIDPTGAALLRSYSYQDTLPAYIWQFPKKWPTMRMWTTVFQAAQRRGLLKFVKPQFSGILDSSRKKWVWVNTLQTIVDNHGYQPEELGENLLDFLNDCTGQDYSKWFGQRLEWLMSPGFKLRVQTRIGTDRSASVKFYTGQIISNERTRDRESIYNRVTAVDVDGSESIRTDAASVKKWNLREQRNETNKNITDNTLRNDLADRYIQQSRDEKSQWSIKVPYDDFGRVPLRDFYVGDTVMFDNTVGAGGLGNYRVMAISISLSADMLVPDVELTLQSIIDGKLIELEKQITRLVNNPRNFSLKDIKDIAIPDAPKVPSGLTYDPKTKKWVATPVTDFGGHEDGIHVFIQTADPAATTTNNVSTGDLWLDTGGS